MIYTNSTTRLRSSRAARTRLAAAVTGFALTLGAAQAAQTYTVAAGSPTIDKWVYPFASNGGATRASGPVFGAVGSDGFDDRDAQFFASFDTSGAVPTNLGATSYQILSAKFTLSISAGDVLLFDGSYDPISTYGPNGQSINGDDPGRPIELYGAAFRNGFTSGTITEATPFRPATAPAEGGRTIYPTDFLAGGSINGDNRDVSNNVSQGFNPIPFAIGQVAAADLNSDGTVKEDAEVTFTLNLANPDVLRYLQLSLDEGRVSFLATSLTLASQGGPTVYPDFYTKENLVGGAPGRLDLQVQVVPEPSPVTLGCCGLGVMVSCWRGCRAARKREESI